MTKELSELLSKFHLRATLDSQTGPYSINGRYDNATMDDYEFLQKNLTIDTVIQYVDFMPPKLENLKITQVSNLTLSYYLNRDPRCTIEFTCEDK